MKALGTQIANGYSPEARILSGLLGPRDSSIDTLVMAHRWSGDETTADRFARDGHVNVVSFDFGWRPNPEGERSTLAKLASHARFNALLVSKVSATAKQFHPGVVFSCAQKWDTHAATYLARHLRRPQVIYLAFNLGPWMGREVMARLRTCAHVVTVSDFIRAQVLKHGVPPERVTTVRPPMAIPPEQPAGTREAVRAELGLPSDAVVIGIAARLDPSKRQKETILAFSHMNAANNNSHLVVAGGKLTTGGTSPAELEDLARSCGVADRVHVLGHRSDMPRLLATFDIFVHPSTDEPLALAVLEAAATGLPVVAWAHGGTPEAVIDGETGLLSPSGDVEGLATSLRKLVDDPSLARSMGQAGKRRVAEYFRPEVLSPVFIGILERVQSP